MFKRAARVPVLTGMILAALLFLPVIVQTVQAAEKTKTAQEMPAIEESKAYQQFKTRPVSDLSKLIYLIDRFAGAKIEIVYDGHYYKPTFAAQLAKFFLAQNYKKETVKEWIMKWCSVSAGGNLIWVKFADNRFKLSRDVLNDEIAALDEVIKSDERKKMAQNTQNVLSSSSPAADAVLEKTANAATVLETPAPAMQKPKAKPVTIAS